MLSAYQISVVSHTSTTHTGGRGDIEDTLMKEIGLYLSVSRDFISCCVFKLNPRALVPSDFAVTFLDLQYTVCLCLKFFIGIIP